jgi:hypothetical protein
MKIEYDNKVIPNLQYANTNWKLGFACLYGGKTLAAGGR